MSCTSRADGPEGHDGTIVRPTHDDTPAGPAYFFHLDAGGLVVEDRQGRTFVDDAAAYDAAVQIARGVLATAVIEGQLPLSHMITVTNAACRALFSVTLADAVGVSAHETAMG